MQVSVSMHTVSIIDMYVRDSKLDVGITGQPEELEQWYTSQLSWKPTSST